MGEGESRFCMVKDPKKKMPGRARASHQPIHQKREKKRNKKARMRGDSRVTSEALRRIEGGLKRRKRRPPGEWEPRVSFELN